jgi:chromosome segregation ATPase
MKRENGRLKEEANDEMGLRLHFEKKLSGILRELNDVKSKLKMSEEELSNYTEENEELKSRSKIQGSSLSLLNQEKIKLETVVFNYQAEAGNFKEEILSKLGIIHQNENRMKELMREVMEQKVVNQELHQEITDKEIRIGVVQSVVMSKKDQQKTFDIQIEKVSFTYINYIGQKSKPEL